MAGGAAHARLDDARGLNRPEKQAFAPLQHEGFAGRLPLRSSKKASQVRKESELHLQSLNPFTVIPTDVHYCPG